MISHEISKLLDTVKKYTPPDYLSAEEHEPRIVVGEIVSRAARYYEKARYSVEYREEHLLRRTAIERILRRRLTIDFVQEKSGRLFLVELIQAGYLSNKELPERVVVPVQAVIEKTVFFISLLERLYSSDEHTHYRSLLIKLATSEIDALLFPSIVDEATVKAFYKIVKNHITVAGSKKSKEELDVQTYLACRRGLLKDDDTVLFYHLWLLYYPEWETLNSVDEDNDEKLKEIAQEFDRVCTLIEQQLKSTIHRRLVPRLKNDIIYFSILQKIVAANKGRSEEIFNDPEQLYFVIKNTVTNEYQKVQDQVQKSSWRAVIYIFITKITLALLIELPFDIFVLDQIQYVALGINILFHPILLFFITSNISEPGAQNTTKIAKDVHAIIHDGGHADIFLNLTPKRSVWRYIAGVLYFGAFAFSFGTILWFLQMFNFNVVSALLFLFFLTFVSYFGIRIRYVSHRWVVHSDEQSFFSFVWDLLTLPIISLGRWLTIKFSSINIFIFIMDFIIEAPFKVVLQAIDTFALFVKEKKDEIY